ncbi:MAG: cyclic nucleotide-binding domain-containing protein [Oscillospiraceae bacterium]|nr:cyclic nucleotide-binding domain-containing protein [Oscillospiraceae bacterium]
MPKQRIDKKYLRDFFKLGENDEAELVRIEKKMVRLQFENGADICSIDDEADGVYFLESGSVAVLDRDGTQINLMHSGQYFGEYAVLARQHRLSTVRSIGRTIVYRIDGDELLRILQRHPDVYGELIHRVYSQVTNKHTQINLLSGMRRGILKAPENETPMSPKRLLIHYGITALIFLLALLLAPRQSAIPVFVIPLVFMVAYVLYTKRTLGSLILAGMLATLLACRSELFTDYTDLLIETMASPDNAYTVLVMALMGGVVTLIQASGAVTALKKLVARKVRSKAQARFALVGIMALTAIDDCLNMLCAAGSVCSSANEQRISREELSLPLSLLPTVLSSFLPFSLWGVFVVSIIGAAVGGQGATMFVRSIPFNFFSIVSVLAMLALCAGRCPRTRILKDADARVKSGGSLWPPDSERYLPQDDGNEIWGQPRNLLLPILALIVTSVTLRSLRLGVLELDISCGLVVTVAIMFFLYCAQGLMSPESFFDHLISGVESMTLPVMLYILTVCYSTMLEQESMGSFFESVVYIMRPIAAVVPAALFLIFALLTMALGSSWAMYVIGFPIAMHIARSAGLDIPLCIGAICAAGIAGEKLCVFTGDELSVGTAIGCAPDKVLAVRIPYAAALSLASFLLYLVAGIVSAAA